MFCCNRKENHQGEIVTAVCMESQCVRVKNQLSCVLCLQEEHKGHSTTSMRMLVPSLLQAHSDKIATQSKLQRLITFVGSEFGFQFMSGESMTRDNIIERVIELMLSLKRQVESTSEEINKMKIIFKNLNKNANSQLISKHSPTKSSDYFQEQKSLKDPLSPLSPKKSQLGANTKSKLLLPMTNYKAEIDTFSISAKHPYLNLSSDLRTVTKVSHSGHRFGAIGAKPFNQEQEEIRLHIDKSVSGNIMLGICHQSIVSEKYFTNCYGINSGTYLIGQNGSNPTTAISFHHCLTVMNRKEVVGWNFQAGDYIVVGVNFEEQLLYFRREGKLGNVQFRMKLRGQSKPQVNFTQGGGFKLIVLLQNEGDQVSIIEQQR